MTHTLILTLGRQRQADRRLELKASQIYRVKLRTAMDTKKKPMLRENKILSL